MSDGIYVLKFCGLFLYCKFFKKYKKINIGLNCIDALNL